MIWFRCPSCRKAIKVREEFAGGSGLCPHCNGPLVVPEKTEADLDTRKVVMGCLWPLGLLAIATAIKAIIWFARHRK
ncbi:MAG TPA: hypothetical protein VFE47_19115 [Tepidisphaeraceae bacterium]|jgi:hypothetical protein|nr:hypothetical protein [Tepidisphaeraceae bacterium]